MSSSSDSFVSFWEELNSIPKAEVLSLQQEGVSAHEAESSDAEASEEAWEEVGSGSSGGSSVWGESSARRAGLQGLLR